MVHSMKTIDASMSLHNVMNMIQLSYMAEQARQVGQHLSALIENTSRVAPVRRNPYKLQRPDEVRTLRWPSGAPRSRWMEKHWEEACYHKWKSFDDGLDQGVPFRRLLSYQVMLRDRNTDKGWGEVDLLGLSDASTPVIVELKSKTSEYLLRSVVEGVAYAVAIQKAWSDDQCPLRNDWLTRLAAATTPDSLTTVPVAVVAPRYCWRRWMSKAERGMSGRVTPEALNSIDDLCLRLAEFGYPVTFVEIRANGVTPANAELPELTGASPVSIF